MLIVVAIDECVYAIVSSITHHNLISKAHNIESTTTLCVIRQFVK